MSTTQPLSNRWAVVNWLYERPSREISSQAPLQSGPQLLDKHSPGTFRTSPEVWQHFSLPCLWSRKLPIQSNFSFCAFGLGMLSQKGPCQIHQKQINQPQTNSKTLQNPKHFWSQTLQITEKKKKNQPVFPYHAWLSLADTCKPSPQSELRTGSGPGGHLIR